MRDLTGAFGAVRALPANADILTRMRCVTDAYWRCLGTLTPHALSEADRAQGRTVSWCGFYTKTDGADEMELVCREPKPACSPIGLHGMCGRGWKERRAFVVPDVRTLGAGYVACDPRDQSELVVPVFDSAGACVGVFDVDSYELGALTLRDAAEACGLLEAAGLLQPRWLAGGVLTL